MNNPQPIIVYRSQAEYDFYQSGMMIPMLGGMAVGFVVFLALCKLFERHVNRWNGDRGGNNMLLGGFGLLAFGAGMFTFNWLMI